MKSRTDSVWRIAVAFTALILIVLIGLPRTAETEDPCYQHVDQQRNRLPARLDITRMRKIANAIAEVSWQVVPARDTAPAHCAYHGSNEGSSAPTYWPGDGQPSPSEVGVPYKWGGSDDACAFACFHDPQHCSQYSQPIQCPSLVRPYRLLDPRSAGLHNLLQLEDQACTTGIDCSGLVSVAWGLPWKVGTPNVSEKENWCTLSFVAYQVTRIAVKHDGVSSIDQAFWKVLQPGDALVMPGHVVLVDYPIVVLQGISGACVWEASGHQKVKKDGKMVPAEQMARRETIDETWLAQENKFQSYDLIVFRFNGHIDGLDQSLPLGEIPCGTGGTSAAR